MVKKETKAINKDKKDAKPSPFESMLYTNLSGAIVALGFCAITGQIQEGVAICQKSPEFVQALAAFSLCSALGQCFIYYTVTEFSPLLLSTVTTTRKIFSTIYSVFRNPGNSLNEMQWGGCILVFGAIIGEMVLAQFGGGGKKKVH